VRKVSPFRAVVLAGALCLVSACSVNFDAGTLGVPATVAEAAGSNVQGTKFQVHQKAVFLFLGMIPTSKPSLERALAGQLLDGAEVANLTISVRSRFTDLLISGLTLGLIIPRSVTYEGVIVDRDR